MSMSTLSAVAIQRDKGEPQRAKRKPKTDAEARETEAKGYFNLLVSAIPTEPLALYTFLIAGIVATIDSGENQRLTMRWIIYAAMILFIVLWLGASCVRRPKAERKRKFPFVEVLAAAVAFGAWGLVMPESPLNAELSGDDREVWTLIITVVGVALLGLLTGSLKKPAKT
jgi:quinol-cytochrome oxidoreductase complex cytochrome b subunit